MGNKWVRMLVGLVLSVVIFGGVAAFVFDQHPLGGSGPAHTEQQACLERAFAESERASCYDTYVRESERNYASERVAAAVAGLVSVGLFWLLVYFFYLRARRRRGEQTVAGG
jgi:hypothetical protein